MIGRYTDATLDLDTQMFQTEAAMIAAWRSGQVSGVICSENPGGASCRKLVSVQTIIVVSNKIDDAGFGGKICAGSPEQRDWLAAVTQGSEQPADLKLMTQSQYLISQDCVDVYVTATESPSAFLRALQTPVYVKSLTAWTDPIEFGADQYNTTYNIEPVKGQRLRLYLWE